MQCAVHSAKAARCQLAPVSVWTLTRSRQSPLLLTQIPPIITCSVFWLRSSPESRSATGSSSSRACENSIAQLASFVRPLTGQPERLPECDKERSGKGATAVDIGLVATIVPKITNERNKKSGPANDLRSQLHATCPQSPSPSFVY